MELTRADTPVAWSLAQAEQHLLGLERFGMRFGLARMRRLLTAVGNPERSLRVVHVVGTNGKTSTTRMTAAILEAHGLHCGSYVSPHLTSFTERLRVGDEDVGEDELARAVQRTARAAARVERSDPDDGPVTQFELLTAAALCVLGARDVDVAVVEAGLGGRHDATNVLDAEVVALTNVALEHTRWLGSTLEEIAAEKLAVLGANATLCTGPLPPGLAAQAADAAAAAGAETVVAADQDDAPAGLVGYQRVNFCLAAVAARQVLGTLRPELLARAVAGSKMPGRLQVVERWPLVVLDGAHNPAGIAALRDAIDEVVGDRALIAVVSILDDKDARAMLATLLPRCAGVVFTACHTDRSLAPRALAELAGQLGLLGEEAVDVRDDPREALDLARGRAGSEGAVVVTGSIHLVGDLTVGATGRRVASSL